mmetsp:Transcript_107766/g.240431  ORF Transcript_107766/g.240431 Transcript_107766/m.240431 type:complete len:102 (+) Transcript_107766:33-338(+)
MKAFPRPPELVVHAVCCMLILLGRKPYWDEAKKTLADPCLLSHLGQIDMDSIRPVVWRKAKHFQNSGGGVSAEDVAKESEAAGAIHNWNCAILSYLDLKWS